MNFRISTKSVIAILSMAILILASSSCSRFGKSKGQSIEFATFIKAYTGGVVSDKSTIRVELASDIPEAMAGTDLKDGVLTFTPSVKGTARWLSGSMIEFIPETGALMLISSISGYPRMNGSVVKHNWTDIIFDFNFGISLSSKSSVLLTRIGLHHSLYVETFPNRFAIKNA